ncbi:MULTISPECIES: phage protease [unclassified Serratia (in: enterobacteria)]|uniref:phage protease n=1 Tax=unclassified Serratia (in: enterobacteria) TaxID=2647522 RepID=UPI0027FF3930|nr:MULTISPECIES: phage protease [unclassified Serratia (in: enterobacteria)]MDQ7097414.1 phage protease [Serratia sp. MF2]MDQ7104883.1 phage protease [Serratia sp. MF1(2023)]
MSVELLALCFELPDTIDNKLPDWLPMLPIGPFTGRDGRSWINNEPEAVISKSLQFSDVPFDMEHSTELKGTKGDPAPAYGWIDDLKIQGDQVWAHVAWNAEGAELILGKKYRYYSPAFGYTADGLVTKLSSVGLTNKPNLFVPALNSENTDMKLPEQIAAVLGLGADATVESGVTAIQSLKTAEQVALNRAQNPDLTTWVPKETHLLALNRAETAETALKERAEKDAEGLVDAAIAAGKIAPANRDMYLATCRTEEGRKQFGAFTEAAPVIVNTDPEKKKAPGQKDKQALTETEVAMCRSMGITEAEFLAAKPNATEE